MIICKTCGVEAADERQCPGCGADLGIRMTLEPIQVKVVVPPVSTVLDGKDPATGDARIRVTDPGAVSEARMSPAGRLDVSVTGAGGVGRRGEGRVIKTFGQALRESGLESSFRRGQDEKGEDGVLTVDAHEYVFQVVTAPAANDFWREASQTSATTSIDSNRAADWLEEVISSKSEKTPPAQREETVLAVDARHAGFLASGPILGQYLSEHGDPAATHGWASVWVVGPTATYCKKVGSGNP